LLFRKEVVVHKDKGVAYLIVQAYLIKIFASVVLLVASLQNFGIVSYVPVWLSAKQKHLSSWHKVFD
jgi:hypothetical protein